ncbi:hypothetical protein CcaCcLH18_04038 [Colletotrichum camelliae]|nr:hypothetical protein CcaCcLH18_04038 [Colletotrichum camelliae]
MTSSALNVGFHVGCAVFSAPYVFIFRKFILAPIEEVIHRPDSNVTESVKPWLQQRKREAVYAQLGSGFAFAGVVGMLSWPTIYAGHWLTPACLFTSIFYSIAAIFFAAQQMMLIEGTEPLGDLKCFRKEYWAQNDEIRWIVVFAWQAPVMFLSYALVLLVYNLTYEMRHASALLTGFRS